MKKALIFSLLLFNLTALTRDEPVSKLNGAYRQVRYKYGPMKDWQSRDSVTVVKVFRDGYWMAAFYDDHRRGRSPFDGVGGGTYQLKDGKYVETLSYYSWDSTAVGKVYSFKYTLDQKQYEQYGVIDSDKYPNYPINEVMERVTAAEPLKDSSLEGVWFMKEGYWGGKNRFGEGKYKDFQVVKIFAYPMVVYAYYNPRTRQFDGAGGAMYQYDGQTLTETNEFWSWQADGQRKGRKEQFKIAVQDGQFVQQGWEGKLREVFTKATNLSLAQAR